MCFLNYEIKPRNGDKHGDIAKCPAASPFTSKKSTAFLLFSFPHLQGREDENPKNDNNCRQKFNWNFDNKHNLILDLLLSAGTSWALPRSNTLPGILFFDVWSPPPRTFHPTFQVQDALEDTLPSRFHAHPHAEKKSAQTWCH